MTKTFLTHILSEDSGRRKRAKTAGFTLIEVMVAVAILAVIMALTYASIYQSAQGKEDTEREDLLRHSMSLALGKMKNDIQTAFIVSDPDFLGSEGKRKFAFVGKEDRLDFVSFSHVRYFNNSSDVDYAEVGYAVENGKEEDEGKVLVRRESGEVDEKPEEGGEQEPLVDHVKEFKIEYYNSKTKEWRDDWDSSQLDFSNQLPHAVKVELQVENPDSETPFVFSTIIDLKMYAKPIRF